MIIPRKYEWLGILYEQDPEVKDLVDKAFSLAEITSEYKPDYWNIITVTFRHF